MIFVLVGRVLFPKPSLLASSIAFLTCAISSGVKLDGFPTFVFAGIFGSVLSASVFILSVRVDDSLSFVSTAFALTSVPFLTMSAGIVILPSLMLIPCGVLSPSFQVPLASLVAVTLL